MELKTTIFREICNASGQLYSFTALLIQVKVSNNV